jgi:hypothetical protein
MTFPKKITKEEILQLPEFKFEGKVHVISNEADIKDATTVLAREKILGFDTDGSGAVCYSGRGISLQNQPPGTSLQNL